MKEILLNWYFVGMLVSLLNIYILDWFDKKAGIVNKFDRCDDIIVLVLLILISWGSLFLLSVVYCLEKIKKYCKE